MVDILPFKGLRYNSKKTGDYSKLLAPPYDIIDESQKIFLKNLSPYNIVNLTLPDDIGEKSRYENARDILSAWIAGDVLQFDSEESIYIFRENFTENGAVKSFMGFAALLKIEEYGKGKVLRHEKTLPKPREDRLNLLTACRANLEFILTIFNDDDKKVTGILNSFMQQVPEVTACAMYDDSICFNLWSIKNMKEIENIIRIMKDRTVLIADGHHRYETSRLYRERTLMPAGKPKNDIISGCKGAGNNTCRAASEDYILCLFVAGNQKEISIHPTHRLIRFSGRITAGDIINKLGTCFNIEKIKNKEELIDAKMKQSRISGKKSICVLFKDSGCYYAELKTDLPDIYRQLNIPAQPFIAEFEYLDVNILHKLILSELLRENEIEEIRFLHTIKEVKQQLSGTDKVSDFDAAFILNAPEIKTVESLSGSGLIMPQKSTYFYPKPCSGMVMYKFE
ncbi:MAG: DUF1015 domain-containing protein [Actinobacteria bacterium]|nr:DUF1015 domain-containing protein [Actinomycetota bacterium]